MPLIQGYSARSFEKNVRMLRREKREVRQLIAIAYDVARKALKRAGLRETPALRNEWKKAIKSGLFLHW